MEFDIPDAVVSLVDIPSEGIRAGMVGAIVHVFARPERAYLVEFCNENGEALAIPTMYPNQIALADLRKAA